MSMSWESKLRKCIAGNSTKRDHHKHAPIKLQVQQANGCYKTCTYVWNPLERYYENRVKA